MLKKILFGPIGGTIVQLMILVLILPFILFLLHELIPDQMGNLLEGIAAEVPYLGNCTDVAIYAFTIQANFLEGLLKVFAALINVISENIITSTIIGLCVLACREVCVAIKMRGLPLLAVVFGSIIGVMINYCFIHSNTVVQILIGCFLIVLDVVLILITELGTGRIQKIIGILFMGVHTIIACLFIYYFYCLIHIFTYGVKSLPQLLAMVLVPLFALIVMVFADYMLGCAKRLIL